MTTERTDSRASGVVEPDSIVPSKASSASPRKVITEAILEHEKPAGGPVNRFLLCSLVSQSARRLKNSSFQSQDSSSVTMIAEEC